MVSLGLARALTRRGFRVQTFKKGPDYIDSAWLALAARSRQATLDPFFSTPKELLAQFASRCDADICLIEGNRGLFDGLDAEGSCSTAFLASLLHAPILLVADCTKMTRTVAALVSGCATFDPSITIGGVILNRVGRDRQEQLIRESLKRYCTIPVLGCLPRQAKPLLNERHMGLTCAAGNARADATLDAIADWAEQHIDMDAVIRLANESALHSNPAHVPKPDANKAEAYPLIAPQPAPTALGNAQHSPASLTPHPGKPAPRIGYIYDAALWFYYAENLDALTAAGAQLVPLSILSKKRWPPIDGLYIGGGLPELHARKISQNTAILSHIRHLSANGLPIYAECGGLMILVSTIRVHKQEYPMTGIFPCTAIFGKHPKGIGYVEATVERETPFFPAGLALRGHEFHFSHCEIHPPEKDPPPTLIPPQDLAPPALRLSKGFGLGPWPAGAPNMDGLLVNNTYAAYTHLFAPAVPCWADRFVSCCRSL